MSCDVSGSGLGMCLDGFGMVLEEMSDEVETNVIFKIDRECFHKLGALQNIVVSPSPHRKTKSKENMLFVYFYIFNSRYTAWCGTSTF